MRRSIQIFVLLLLGISAGAQTDPLFSQHIFLPSVYNPSQVVPEGKLDVSAGSRQQWIGLKNAPVDYLFNGNMKIGKRIGVGILAVSDEVGFESTVSAGLSVGYRFPIRDDISISAGVRTGILNKTLDGTRLIYEESVDQNGLYNMEAELRPDFAAGLSFVCKKISLGISATHLLQSLPSSTVLNPSRHYYGYLMYSMKSGEWKLTPGVSVRSNEFITQTEVFFMADFRSQFQAALVGRLSGSYSAQFGIAISDRLLLGYSYDIDSKKIRTECAGSHELIARYRVPEKLKDIIPLKSTRFF